MSGGFAPGRDPIVGDWDLRIQTPVGNQRLTITITHEPTTGLRGSAITDHEHVALRQLRADGRTARWTVHLSRPVRLALSFHVQIDGERLTGTARLGLIRSPVTGWRCDDSHSNN